MDLDYRCMGGLVNDDGIDRENCQAYGVESSNKPVDGELQNSLMASIPDHPFWAHMLNMASTTRRATFFQSWFGTQEILSSTGPGILSDSYEEYMQLPGKPEMCPLPALDFNNQGMETAKYSLHMSTQVSNRR
jgi:mannosyltransferase OCH1-like enzyme